MTDTTARDVAPQDDAGAAVGDDPFDVTIITGMSGAGRSAAADVLEDLGFFVIDNVPPALIPKVAELALTPGQRTRRYGLVVDVRSGFTVSELRSTLDDLRDRGTRIRILFLDASDEALVRRFEASRRPHPLGEAGQISQGIAAERTLLEELKGDADLIVDTSVLNVHELRDRISGLFAGDTQPTLTTTVVSFGYKHGLPLDVDLVFDCRFLPNPHWIEELRPLIGLDAPVRDYVLGQADAQRLLVELERLLAFLVPAYEAEGKSYLSIGIGCTGGRHRSVVLAEELARILEGLGHRTRVRHRDASKH
jgi:RNase adapter protein RapZ